MEFPQKGDIIIADAEPHAGHEMGGHNPKVGNIRRHYVVMSTTDYNGATGMLIALPVTTANYVNNPRYMPILINGVNGASVKGYVVLWQLQNFNFKARNGVIVNHVSAKVLKELQLYVNDMVGSE